jgi:hypothetical protein
MAPALECRAVARILQRTNGDSLDQHYDQYDQSQQRILGKGNVL